MVYLPFFSLFALLIMAKIQLLQTLFGVLIPRRETEENIEKSKLTA